jgi:hypothetical protein
MAVGEFCDQWDKQNRAHQDVNSALFGRAAMLQNICAPEYHTFTLQNESPAIVKG